MFSILVYNSILVACGVQVMRVLHMGNEVGAGMRQMRAQVAG